MKTKEKLFDIDVMAKKFYPKINNMEERNNYPCQYHAVKVHSPGNNTSKVQVGRTIFRKSA